MNRILFETSEIVNGIATFGGVRAEHVLNVLHGEVGQILKTGEINGPIGTSEIVEIGNFTSARNADSHGDALVAVSNAKAPSFDESTNRRIDESFITVRCHHNESSLQPWVDLILAPPRPRVMKRLLPQLATMGVGRIFLVGAKKVEKDFWGATLLKEENYRPLLVEGLMQAGTSILPTLETRRNFRRFVNDELDTLFPTPRRIVAHPYEKAKAKNEGEGEEKAKNEDEGEGCGRAARDAQPIDKKNTPLFAFASDLRLNQDLRLKQRILLAIGPEGGWTDEEVALLEAHGFVRYSLGSRILRTDTATIALLAKLNDE